MDDLTFALLMFLGGTAIVLFIDAFAEEPPRALARIWNAIAHPRRRKEHPRG